MELVILLPFGVSMDTEVAALFVDGKGCYVGLPGVDPWPESRDARNYQGPHPVVAHPPCQLWGPMANVNYARYGGEHNRPGNDGGCFASALAAVRKFGGVLEHPAFTRAWAAYGLTRPLPNQWHFDGRDWVCEVWQSAYGHQCQKRTWLLYSGANPPADLNWARQRGTHRIGWRNKGEANPKPTLSKRKASATPLGFREALLGLARNCGGKKPTPL